MQLLPKWAEEWTRRLAHALFAGCVITWVVVFLFSTSSRYRVWWYYAAPVIGRLPLPALGGVLGVTCVRSRRLHVGFRAVALVLAALSVLLGPVLVFALAR
jgi:hypothetical protein